MSLAILHRPFAGSLVWTRSPPLHLLYQLLNMVPVCGGGWVLRRDGSTWTLAVFGREPFVLLGFLGGV